MASESHPGALILAPIRFFKIAALGLYAKFGEMIICARFQIEKSGLFHTDPLILSTFSSVFDDLERPAFGFSSFVPNFSNFFANLS